MCKKNKYKNKLFELYIKQNIRYNKIWIASRGLDFRGEDKHIEIHYRDQYQYGDTCNQQLNYYA